MTISPTFFRFQLESLLQCLERAQNGQSYIGNDPAPARSVSKEQCAAIEAAISSLIHGAPGEWE